MRIPKYDLKIFRDFKRSKFQFIAIIIIIILGVGLYIGLSGSFLDLSTSYKYTYDRLNLADFSITVAAAPETVVEKVKGMENVLQASGQLEYETGYERASYDRAILKLSGIEPGKKVNKIHVLEGRNFKNSEEKKVGIIISQFAEYNGIEVGDNINLNINNREVNIEIIGKASSPDNIVVVMGKENPMPSPSVYGILYMPLGQLQEITGATNRINKIDVIVENSQKLNYTLENVKQKLESYNIISDVKQEDFPSVKMLRLDLEGLDELSKFFPILFFIIASFSIYIMLARLIMSQRREIGVARAIGYSRRQILFHYVKYALYIVIIGSILGVAFGLLITRTITIFYAQALGIPFIKNQIYYGVIFQGFIISLVFGIVSAVLPARFTLSIKPAESMRMEQEGRLSFRPNSLSEKIIRGMLKFSLIAKLAIRNIFRNKKRTFFTVIGMVFSIILLFVSISMFDSTEGMLDKWLNKVTRWDIKAIGSKNIPEDEIEDIESWQGVTLVEPIIEKKAKFKKGYQEYDGSVKGIIKDSKLHQFSPVNYPVAELETGKAMLNLGLKYKMDIKPGDYLTLETEAGDQMTFEVIDFTDEMVGISAYITYKDAQKLYNMRNMTNNMLVKVEKNYTTRVDNRLFDQHFVEMTLNKQSILSDIRELMDLSYSFIYVMIFFGAILAFSLIFNTVTVNVMERKREYATMRMMGASYWLPFKILSMENLIIGIVSTVPGVISGYLISRYTLTLYNSELLTLEFFIFPRTYIIILATVFAVLFLSQIPSLFYIKNLDMVEITRERVS